MQPRSFVVPTSECPYESFVLTISEHKAKLASGQVTAQLIMCSLPSSCLNITRAKATSHRGSCMSAL